MLDKSPARPAVNVPNDLTAFWMPFTANRAFKKAPRLLAGAKDMHYFTTDGRKIIDAAAGMWCSNAGHGRTQIATAIAKQAEALDYAPPFQFGIPQAFELASRIVEIAPKGLDHVFFCNYFTTLKLGSDFIFQATERYRKTIQSLHHPTSSARLLLHHPLARLHRCNSIGPWRNFGTVQGHNSGIVQGTTPALFRALFATVLSTTRALFRTRSLFGALGACSNFSGFWADFGS